MSVTRLHPVYGCREARDRLTDYLEGALGPAGRTGIEAHLAACGACHGLLRQTRATIAALPLLLAEPAPARLRQRLLLVLRDPSGRAVASPPPRPLHGPERAEPHPSGDASSATGTPDAWTSSRPA